MATRTYFTFFPGVVPPHQFDPARLAGAVPTCLSMQDLWEDARGRAPSLLFRVRSESDPLEAVDFQEDTLESCVGVVDAITRWRVVFAMTRQLINAIRHPALKQACTQAMVFVSGQHPASVTTEQRQGIGLEIMKIIREGVEGQPAPHPFEQKVAADVIRLVQADNDVEAASYVPFYHALCPFSEKEEAALFGPRLASIETLSGAILLSEAAQRLSERQPAWLFAPMPTLKADTGGPEED